MKFSYAHGNSEVYSSSFTVLRDAIFPLLDFAGENNLGARTGRPVAKGWYSVANATPGQQNTSLLPPLGILLALFLSLHYPCS